jgi:hypothetical protein
MYIELIHSLYAFDWYSEEKIVVAFSDLLYQIVSSTPSFIVPTIQMLVKNLFPNHSSASKLGKNSYMYMSYLYLMCLISIILTSFTSLFCL